jgi:DNA modification methylase
MGAKPMPEIETNTIHTGDCFDVLNELPESSVHMCMTSPPYYGLRDYSHEDQIGLEETLDEYIARLLRVGDALRRVLRDDGSWWLNLGDSYGDNKQKMLVPHRVAIALQDSGWVVRNDVTWVKPNPMPQSVKDRLNTTTEQIFHLTPAPDYWYDLDAIREPHTSRDDYRNPGEKRNRADENDAKGTTNHELGINDQHFAGKNPGDVFEVTTKPFPDAHFAVYPAELVEKPIKASCPPTVCAECGAPYEREVEREPGEYDYSDRSEQMNGNRARTQSSGTQLEPATAEFKGWTQTCDCDTDATESGICLDPFAGAGTTCLKAKELGRRFVGIELNPEYADMARARIGLSPNDPANVRDDDAQRGLETFADGGETDA